MFQKHEQTTYDWEYSTTGPYFIFRKGLMMHKEYITNSDEKVRQSHEKRLNSLIDSSVEFTKNYEQFCDFKFIMDIGISNDFNASCSPIEIKEKTYKININTESYDAIYNALNILLYKENMDFYKLVSCENEYDSDKANLYYDILQELALKYLIFHELAHAYLGHFIYICNVRKLPFDSLYLVKDNNGLSSIERQIMEMSADKFAADMLISQITFPETIYNINKFKHNVIKGTNHAFFLTLVSSTLVFCLFGNALGKESNTQYKNLEDFFYLPIRTRLRYLIQCLVTQSNRLNYEHITNENIGIDDMTKVALVVEEWVNMYLNTMRNTKVYSTENNQYQIEKKYIEHICLLQQYYNNNMKNEFDKISPIPLI
jgi:hypothetical protein